MMGAMRLSDWLIGWFCSSDDGDNEIEWLIDISSEEELGWEWLLLIF